MLHLLLKRDKNILLICQVGKSQDTLIKSLLHLTAPRIMKKQLELTLIEEFADIGVE